MKRRYIYILTTLLIILSVAIITFNDSISYSANTSQICNERGFSSSPIIYVDFTDGANVNGTKSYQRTNLTSADLPTPTKSGYTFLGWYQGGSLFEARAVGVNVPTSSGTVKCFKRIHYSATARWRENSTSISPCSEPKSVPLYYRTNGGSSVPSSTTVTAGVEYQNGTLPTPTRSGYTFIGWYVDEGLTTRFNGSNIPVVASSSGNGCPQYSAFLYAKWEKIKEVSSQCEGIDVYTLYFETNGGSYIAPQTNASGVFSFPTPVRSGYMFDGWFKDASLKNRATPLVTGVNYTLQSSSGCSKSYTGTIYARWNQMVEDGQPPNNNGNTTANNNNGGNNSNTNTNNNNAPIDGGNTVHVCSNIINNLIISFETNGGEELDELDICLTCEPEDVTLPQPEKKGQNFVGWYSDETLENEVIVQGLNTEVQLTQFKLEINQGEDGCNESVAHTKLYARYEAATCKTPDIAYIDINLVKGGDEAIETIKSCLDCDNEVTEMPIVYKEGYLFGGWYIDADYSRLVNKKININNAVKYMNVTRNFENECSTDTISTILYAKWIPVEEVKGVYVMYISQGNVVAEKQYDIKTAEIEQPSLKDKNSKLLGWYTDSTYEILAISMNDIIKDVYGAEFRNGQLFVYVYAKTEEVKKSLFENNKLIILGIIVIVVIGVGYIIINESKDKKKKKMNNKNKNNNNSNNVGQRVTWHT